jgi:DNA-binding beta-propeller fold protein YncE
MNALTSARFLKSWKCCCSSALALTLVFMLTGMDAFSQQGTVTTLGNTIGYAGAGSTDGLTTGAKFNFPAGIALDPSGTNLFLADSNNNSVRWVSNLGNESSSYTTTAFTNGISHPVAIAIDSTTNIYVLNHGLGTLGTNGTILEFNGNLYLSSGSHIKSLIATNASHLTNATSLALDGAANLFVTLNSNTVIRIAAGTGVRTTVGIITNKGTSLRGVAVTSNYKLALTDAGNNGIWLMDPTITNNIYANSWQFTGFHGAGDTDAPPAYAAFNDPENIARAGNGILVVSDCKNNKVKWIDASGNVNRLFGVNSKYWSGNTRGWKDGTINANEASDPVEADLPFGLAIGPDGTVYDTEQHWMLLREATGTGLTGPQPSYPPVFNNLAGIAFDSSGNNLLIADKGGSVIQNLDLTDNQTTTNLSALDGISHPASVLLDTNDNVYVLNQNAGTNGNILSFDPWGNLLATNVTGLVQPTAFTMDANGNLFVTEQSTNILVVFPSGTSTTLVSITTNASVDLQGIALFDDGTIAVSDAGNHVIWTVNSITKLVTKLTGQLGQSGTNFGTSNLARLYQPHQLARAGNNQLVIADTGNNRLVTVTRSGSITNALNSTNASVWFGHPNDPAAAGNPNFVPMLSPVGVAVSSAGKVFTSETYYQDIRGLTTPVTAPAIIPIVILPFFNNPAGIALDSAGLNLFAADPANNRVSVLNFGNNLTTTYLDSGNGLDTPVDVSVDGSDNLFVLNQGTAGNGYILEFNKYGNLIMTNATGLSTPVAMAFDNSGNILVAESAGTILMHTVGSSSNTVEAVINTNANVQLGGIALLDDGTITVSDTGNDVIWQINAVSKAVSLFTGQVGTPGNHLGVPPGARLNQPARLIRAAGNLLVAADSGNNQIVTIDATGTITSSLISTNGSIWFGVNGDPFDAGYVPMASPNGLALGAGGDLFVSEDIYKDIREITGTGLNQLGIGGGGGTGTNAVIIPPTISPNAGYFPMGQDILVTSPNPAVYYTTDGSEPTTNSTPVSINGNVGHIHWFNTTEDLTFLRVKAFVSGTNASDTVSGQPVATNTIGIPPDFNPMIQAGIGSTIVIPVVCNLGTNQQIESYQFRCEIYPINNSNTPVIIPLSIIPTNDFVPVVTAIQNGSVGTFNYNYYSLGLTNGIAFSTAITNGNNGNTSFKNYAVVQMLEVQIPYTANVGDTYGVNILYPSATSDGYNDNVPLTPMAPVTIVATNIPYVVGDSASTAGAWYNAGTFGDGNLDNSDVNQAFYASSGLRTPYSFSDVFNAMDAYPPDDNGYVGGDGQIRFLDWQTILERSLRLDTNNWSRAWSVGGDLIELTTNLVVPHIATKVVAGKVQSITAPWYRQALVGGNSVGNVAPGSTVNVPVYVTLQNGSTLSGLQFRTVITPQGGAPAIAGSPQLNLASGVTSPYLQKSFKAAEAAFGWQLGSFGYQSRSSNFLGWVSFVIPPTALAGQAYTVSFANPDGAPDLDTQYNFESRSATVTVNAASPPASICSDEWKIYFFGSTTNPAAADNADPDGDGVPNWMEFLTGTDPTNPQSKLQINLGGLTTVSNQLQTQLNWLTAPGKAYELQSCSNLTGGWTTIATVSGDGTVSSLSDTNSPGASSRYYRLHILP